MRLEPDPLFRTPWSSRLIFTNTVSVLQVDALVAALGVEARPFAVLLTATDATAARRLGKREIGTALAEHIDRSNLAARRLDAAPNTVSRVATDGRPVADVANEILVRAGWVAANQSSTSESA